MYQHNKKTYIRTLLRPLAWIYGLVVLVRNKLFDWGILKEVRFPSIPIICVGNLSVGGTGKTPHIEYLIKILKERYKVAVVSRGYKRKGKKKSIEASLNDSYKDVGDEPYLIKLKHPVTTVVVDANRKRAIRHLLNLPDDKKPDVILMDDGFQHRYVKPSFNIILSDSNRPIYEDQLLPIGHLREPIHNLYKADLVVSTKCPPDMKPIDMRIAYNGFHLYPYQSLVFTFMKYGAISHLTEDKQINSQELSEKEVLLITGIAQPTPLVKYLKKRAKKVITLEYSDHHNYSEQDIHEINEKLSSLSPDKRIAITTEKDIIKFREAQLPKALSQDLYSISIEVAFFNKEDKYIFNKKILNHVRKNTPKRTVHKK